MPEISKQELEKLNSELIAVQRHVARLRQYDEDDVGAGDMDRVELWCRIQLEGGVVTKERLHELWRKDNRGLGGFFIGKPQTLAWTADGKAMITRAAADKIRQLTGKPIEEYAQRYAKKV